MWIWFRSACKFSGYAETYYAYDFNQPVNHDRPGFLYNHNRHNEFNTNLAFLKAAYFAKGIRANLALMTGTYANAWTLTRGIMAENSPYYESGAKLTFAPNDQCDGGVRYRNRTKSQRPV